MLAVAHPQSDFPLFNVNVVSWLDERQYQILTTLRSLFNNRKLNPTDLRLLLLLFLLPIFDKNIFLLLVQLLGDIESTFNLSQPTPAIFNQPIIQVMGELLRLYLQMGLRLDLFLH